MSNFGQMIHGQYTTYSVDGISVPGDYLAIRIGSNRPGFGLDLLSFSAAMSSAQKYKYSEGGQTEWRYSNWSGINLITGDEWKHVDIPNDFNDRLKKVLATGDCNDFIRKVIAKVTERYNKEIAEYNTSHTAKQEAYKPDANDGYELMKGINGKYIFEDVTHGGRGVATVRGSIKNGDAAIILPNRYYRPSEIRKGDDALAYWQNFFVGVAIHEMVHLAGKGVFVDQDLARAAKDLGEKNIGDVEEKFNFDPNVIIHYSDVWNDALGNHCIGVKK